MKGIIVAMSSDLKIISGLKRHSEKAFKKVYYQYKNLVYYHAYNILNNKEDAEDIMQNTFIKLMKNIDAIDDNSNLRQLLSKISKNEAIDLYRRKTNHKEIYDETIINNIKSEEKDNSEINVIMTLNNALNKMESQIMTLKIVFDYSFEEIANELQESIGTIQAKYYKSLKVLKNYYKKGR